MNKVNTKVTKDINNILKTMGVDFTSGLCEGNKYSLRIVSLWEEDYYTVNGDKKRYYFNVEVTMSKDDRYSPSSNNEVLRYSWNKRSRLVRLNRMRKFRYETAINDFFNTNDVKDLLKCIGFEVARWDCIKQITYKEVEKL